MSYSKERGDITSSTLVPQLMACGDSYCPRLTDPITNRVICRCYQGASTVPSHIPNFAAALYHTSIPGEIPSPITSPMQPNHGMRWDTATVPSLGFGSPFSVISPGQQNIDNILRSQMYSYMHSSLDAGNSRRKNATRETTAALKAWLKEHRKNPYPTKAEKIMLAIITRMTLTQVSTWFANARRRLKKENRGEFSSDISFDNMSSSSDDEESTTSVFKAENISRPETTTPIDDLPGYSSIRNEIQSYPSFSFHSSRPFTSTPIDYNMNNIPVKYEGKIQTNAENDNVINSSDKEEAKLDNEHVSSDNTDNSSTDTHPEKENAVIRPRFLPPLISKPKIWSISNIIGHDSATNNIVNDDNAQKD